MYVKINDPEFWKFIYEFDYSSVLDYRESKYENVIIDDKEGDLVNDIDARFEAMNIDRDDLRYYKGAMFHYINLLVAVFNGYKKGRKECEKEFVEEDALMEVGRIANVVLKGREFYSFVIKNPATIQNVSPHGEEFLVELVRYARAVEEDNTDFVDADVIESNLMNNEDYDGSRNNDDDEEEIYINVNNNKQQGAGQFCLFDFTPKAIYKRGLYGIETCRYVKSLWTRFLIGVRMIGDQCQKDTYYNVVDTYRKIISDFRENGELYEKDGTTWLKLHGHAEMVNCYLPNLPTNE